MQINKCFLLYKDKEKVLFKNSDCCGTLKI